MTTDNDELLPYLQTIKLTEKQIDEIKAEAQKWEDRVKLARDKGMEDLALEAEKKAAELRAKQAALESEAAEVRAEMEKIRREAPGRAARQRSIDPDLLEQELLMAAGRMPGTEKEAAADRAFAELEKDDKAQSALDALKAKMNQEPQAAPE